jgi:hypothetical protein
VLKDILTWPARRWIVVATGVAFTALAVGLPTALVPSSLFTRMTSVTWSSWAVWAATALLGGLVLATYVRTHPDSAGRGAGTGASGGILGVLAVGCPVCSKVVVALLGVAGAMQWWAPLQPLLGVASVALLAWALSTRLRGTGLPLGHPGQCSRGAR